MFRIRQKVLLENYTSFDVEVVTEEVTHNAVLHHVTKEEFPISKEVERFDLFSLEDIVNSGVELTKVPTKII